MEEKTFTYLGKEYKERKRTYKPLRINSIKFFRKYSDFEKEYIGEDLYNQYYNTLLQNAIEEDVTEENAEEKSKVLLDKKDIMRLQLEFTQKQSEAYEIFLLDENNTKELCDIYFENSNEIDHNPTDENFDEYYSFVGEVFRYFFFRYKKYKLK